MFGPAPGVYLMLGAQAPVVGAAHALAVVDLLRAKP